MIKLIALVGLVALLVVVNYVYFCRDNHDKSELIARDALMQLCIRQETFQRHAKNERNENGVGEYAELTDIIDSYQTTRREVVDNYHFIEIVKLNDVVEVAQILVNSPKKFTHDNKDAYRQIHSREVGFTIFAVINGDTGILYSINDRHVFSAHRLPVANGILDGVRLVYRDMHRLTGYWDEMN